MKTRKLFFAGLLAFLMTGSTISAQPRFGVKAEVGINKPSLSKEVYSVENMNTFKIGPTVEFMLPVMDFGIDASLLYSNEKMKVKDFKADKSLTEVSSHYIDVPVNLKYKMGIISPLKVYLAAGPYAQFKVAGDEFKLDVITDKVEEKKFQAWINLGLGADVINRVQVGFNYRLKLTDDYSVNEPTWKDLLNDKKDSGHSPRPSIFKECLPM